MDKKTRPFVLSTDYQAPTNGNLSKPLVLSESKNKLNSDKPMSNIDIIELLDSTDRSLNTTEARFQNMKNVSCQIIPTSETDDFDSDEILSFDGSSFDDEPIPLELELSLLEYDSEELENQKPVSTSPKPILVASDLPSSFSGASPLSKTGSMDPNNNNVKQILTYSDVSSLCSEEEKVESDVKSNIKKTIFTTGNRLSCVYPDNTINGSPSSSKLSSKNFLESYQNFMDGNIVNNNCNTSDKRFIKDSMDTINPSSISVKPAPSVSPQKSEDNSEDLSYDSLYSELTQVLRDSDYLLELDSSEEILSLDVPASDIQGSNKVNNVKTDLSNPQLNLYESSLNDTLTNSSPLQPCKVSNHPDESTLIFPSHLTDSQAVQSENLCSSNSLLECQKPPHFVSSYDFEKDKTCKHIPQMLFTKTHGDGIKASSNEIDFPLCKNTSLGIKNNCHLDEPEILKRRLEFVDHAESGKCHTLIEDSVLKNHFKDKSIKIKAAISDVELSLQISKSELSNFNEHFAEQLLTKEIERSMINNNHHHRDNLKNLSKSSNIKVDMNCEKLVLSVQDIWSDQIKQRIHFPMEKVKNDLEHLQDFHCFWNSTNRVASTFSGNPSVRNQDKHPLTKNDMSKEQPECFLEKSTKSNSSKSVGYQIPRKDPLLIISVNSNDSSQKIVTFSNQLSKGDNSEQKQQVLWKNASNECKESVTENKSNEGTEMNTVMGFNKHLTKLSSNIGALKDIKSKDIPKNSDNFKSLVPIDKIPENIYLTGQKQMVQEKNPKNYNTTKSMSVLQRNSKTPQGVRKRKRSSAKKRAKTLISLSKKEGLSTEALVESTNVKQISTDCNIQNCSTTASTNNTNSSLTCQQTNNTYGSQVTTEAASSKRKFVKAKRSLHQQKQLLALMEDKDCLDENNINDRVQWVCCRWNVQSLANQDINLTTSAYIRRQLPAQKVACFQGCLEGQKDYTLAIVAPERKRKHDYDDGNYDSGQAGKKRRLSQEVQLIPANIESLQPDLKLFGNRIIEMLVSSQDIALAAVYRQRNQEVNMFNDHWHHMQCQLDEKQFQEWQYYDCFQYYNRNEVCYQLQQEHNYQQQQLKMTRFRKYNDLMNTFTQRANELRTQYQECIQKMNDVLSDKVTNPGYLKVALRKGPSRVNKYKITYQTVSLTPEVALSMIKEDEIYDSFYSHKV